MQTLALQLGLTLRQRVGSAKHLSRVKGKKQAPTEKALFFYTVKERGLVEEAIELIITVTEKVKLNGKIFGNWESEREREGVESENRERKTQFEVIINGDREENFRCMK